MSTMSTLTEQQRATLRVGFIQSLTVTLSRLRIARDAQTRHTLFGMALGEISTAYSCQLIGWDENLRLGDLAQSASSYAGRDACARKGVVL